MFAFTPAQVLEERLPLLFTFMYDNLKVVPLFAVFGAVFMWRAHRPVAAFLLLYYLANAFYALNYDIPDIWGYFLPNDLVTVVFAGFFGGCVLRWARGRRVWEKGVLALAFLVPLGLFVLHYPRVDKSDNVAQQESVEAALAAVGENAIFVTSNYQSGQAFLYYLLGEGLEETRNLHAVNYGLNRERLRAYLEQNEPLRLFGRRAPSKVGLPLYSYPCTAPTFVQRGFTVTEEWGDVPGLCRLEASPLKLEPGGVDLFQEGLFTENLTPVRTTDALTWRWGLGPATRLTFRLEESQWLGLELRFTTPFEGPITVEVNGEVIARMSPVPNEIVERTLPFRGRAGENRIVLRYSRWNGRPERLFPDERQSLAVRFERLRIGAGERAQTP